MLKIPKPPPEKKAKLQPKDTLPENEHYEFQKENFYPVTRELKIKKKAVKKNKELKHVAKDVKRNKFGQFDFIRQGNYEEKDRFKYDNKVGLGPATKYQALDDYNINARKLYAEQKFEGPVKRRKCTDIICLLFLGREWFGLLLLL